MEVLENVSIIYQETKEFIQDNTKEVCEGEHITVKEVIHCFFFCLWLMFACFFGFWVGRWSIFSCVNCFPLESRQMRYLNFCGEAQDFQTCLVYLYQNRHVCIAPLLFWLTYLPIIGKIHSRFCFEG